MRPILPYLSAPFFLALALVFLVSCSSSDDPARPDGGDDGGGGGGGDGGGGGGDDLVIEGNDTFAAIDEAVAGGDITEGQGLLYKLQSVYWPGQLPAEFRGGSAFTAESRLNDDLLAVWNDLSPSEQDAIAPYLYAPFYEGSWWDLKHNGAAAKNISGDILDSWQRIDTTDGTVRVWYESPATATYAQAVADAMTNVVWDKLTDLMGTTPVSDEDHGGNARYDFVIATLDSSIFGYCHPVYGTFEILPKCDETATFIEINPLKSLNSVPSTVAHEFMHALQMSFAMGGCADFRWLREATATWAQDYCYPTDDYESLHILVRGLTLPEHFMNSPDRSLDEWIGDDSPYSYGAYLFFQYLSRGFSPAWIRYIWQNADTSDPVDAVDQGLQAAGSTDLEERWPQFARFLWNQEHMNRFEDWDPPVTATPRLGRLPVQAQVTTSAPGDTARLDVSLPRLSSCYYEVELPDPSVSGFFFFNGWTYEIDSIEWDEWAEPGLFGPRAQPLPDAERKGRSVDLMYLVTGQDWQTVPLTDSPAFGFCRDIADGNVERVVLVFANGDIDSDEPKEPLGLAPFIWYDNIGCDRWDGSLTWDESWEGSVYRIDASYTWGSGLDTVAGFYAAPPEDDLENWTSWSLQPVSGTMTWTMHYSDGTCTWEGSASWPVDELAIYDQVILRNLDLSGAYDRTFTALLLSQQEREVTEVGSGPAEDGCQENFETTVGAWIEMPHGFSGAVISADGKHINASYREYDGGPVFDLILNAR